MAEYSVQELLDEYVYQRQHKVASEQALQLLSQMAPQLPEKDRRFLAQRIREWELRNSSAGQTAINPPERPTVPTVPAAPPPPPPPAPVAAPANLTIHCPNCGKANPDNSKYCYACGEILLSAKAGKTDQLYEDVEDAAIFGRLSTLNLTVRGFENQPIRIKVGDDPVVIGRTAPDSPAKPDIDLDAFGGKDLGVSRLHAVLQRENQTLTVIDRGSVNHTFINGEKVHPHEKRVIRDGDELRFGRLITRVTFQRELKRLSG